MCKKILLAESTFPVLKMVPGGPETLEGPSTEAMSGSF